MAAVAQAPPSMPHSSIENSGTLLFKFVKPALLSHMLFTHTPYASYALRDKSKSCPAA